MKKIIIAEDELIVAMDLKRMLKRYGFEILNVVNSADKLVNSCKENKPDLVITDIMLIGDKSGIDAAKEINELNETPIIFLTGNTDSYTRSLAKEVHPCDFIVKPYMEKELLESVKRCLCVTGKLSFQ